MLKYFLFWFPMLLIAIGNGLLREGLIKRYTNDFAAHQLSTLTLLFFFTVYIFFIIGRWTPASTIEAAWIGVLWVLLTLSFEFGFGRWQGHTWGTLLAEYNLAKGKLWVLVPLWVGIAPYPIYLVIRKD